MRTRAVLFSSALLFAAIPNAQAQEVITGEGEHGDLYEIHVPAEWNGDLVLFAPGTSLEPLTLPQSFQDAVDQLTPMGFAVAGTSYRTLDWDIDGGAQDVKALRGLFGQQVGAPDHTYLWGRSMGALVAVDEAEKSHPHYDGALLLCGATGGSLAIAERQLTTGALFDYYFPGALGFDVLDPPAVLDLDALQQAATDLLAEDLGNAVQADLADWASDVSRCCRRIWGRTVCNPGCVLSTPLVLDLDQSLLVEMASVDQLGLPVAQTTLSPFLASLPGDLQPTGLPRTLLDTFFGGTEVVDLMGAATGVGVAVVGAITGNGWLWDTQSSRFPSGNEDVVYTGSRDDAALNAGIARFSAHAGTQQQVAHNYTPSGRLRFPVVSLVGTQDPNVWPFNVDLLEASTEDAGFRDNLAIQSVQSAEHCAFTPDEQLGAFLDLTAWVELGLPAFEGDVTGRQVPAAD